MQVIDVCELPWLTVGDRLAQVHVARGWHGR
jgi:hypothetical protein